VINVLIIDSDLGFVFWLGQALYAVGFESLPANNVTEAAGLLDLTRLCIHVLVARHGTPGVEEFAAELHKAQRGHLRRIAVIEEDECAMSSCWDGLHRKPRVPDEAAKVKFIRLLHGVLASRTASPHI
jgi:hypothetical protein